MPATQAKKLYTLAADERATPVMIYTGEEIAWGEVVTKERIRVGAWLRTDMAPAYIHLYYAQVYSLPDAGGDKPTPVQEFFIPLSQVVGFHVMPAVKEALYYDPNELNRKMEAVTAFVGLLHVQGYFYLSEQTGVEQYLDVTREPFLPMYDAVISHPQMPSPGSIKTPFTIVRRELSNIAIGHVG